MKRKLVLAAISCLIGAGVIFAADHSTFQNQSMMKGYITIGHSVIALPDRLRSGDRIEFFNVSGERVMEEMVGQGYMRMNFSRVPSGVYNMVIYRNGDILTEHVVPIAGGGGR